MFGIRALRAPAGTLQKTGAILSPGGRGRPATGQVPQGGKRRQQPAGLDTAGLRTDALSARVGAAPGKGARPPPKRAAGQSWLLRKSQQETGLETRAPPPACAVNAFSARSPRPPLADAYRDACADGKRGARRRGAPGRAAGRGQGKSRFAPGRLTGGSRGLPSSESGVWSLWPSCFWPPDTPGSHKQGSSTAAQRAGAPHRAPRSRAAVRDFCLTQTGSHGHGNRAGKRPAELTGSTAGPRSALPEPGLPGRWLSAP